MLLSDLEMSGPRENSVGARTWASQVGSLDNVAHVIFRHRNLNKHLRFHIIRADGLGCGRGQRGVLKKNLRGRGAYSKRTWGEEGRNQTKMNTQRKFEYPKTHTKHHNRVLKKNEYPTGSHHDEPGVLKKKKMSIPWSIPGQYAWDISQPSPPAPHMRLSVFFGPISPIHVCTHALGCVFLKRQDESTHYPMRKKTNASQIFHHTVKS